MDFNDARPQETGVTFVFPPKSVVLKVRSLELPLSDQKENDPAVPLFLSAPAEVDGPADTLLQSPQSPESPQSREARGALEPAQTMEEEFAQIEAELAAAQAKGDAPTVFGDWIESPDGQLSARHRELARMAARGCRNKDICLRLGYTPGRVSILLRNPKIRAEILRYQDRAFDKELGGRLTEIGPDAMDVIESAIRGELNLKPGERVEHAKWAMEKLTGKATQKHELESGSLGRLLDKLDQMQNAKEVLELGTEDKGEGVQDVEFKEADPVTNWLDENLD